MSRVDIPVKVGILHTEGCKPRPFPKRNYRCQCYHAKIEFANKTDEMTKIENRFPTALLSKPLSRYWRGTRSITPCCKRYSTSCLRMRVAPKVSEKEGFGEGRDVNSIIKPEWMTFSTHLSIVTGLQGWNRMLDNPQRVRGDQHILDLVVCSSWSPIKNNA